MSSGLLRERIGSMQRRIEELIAAADTDPDRSESLLMEAVAELQRAISTLHTTDSESQPGPDRQPPASVAERNQCAQTLRDSEALSTAILDGTPSVMVLVDGRRRIRQVNQAGVVFAECSTDEMIGSRPGDALRCLHALDDPRGCGFGPACERCVVRKTVLDTLATGQAHAGVSAALQLAKESGTEEVQLLISTTPVELSGGSMVLMWLVDITEYKRVEDLARERGNTLAHVSRVNVLGEMASGIAHELNQPLCAITSSAEGLVRMIEGRQAESDGPLRAARLISSQAHLASDIIRRVRKFVQKEDPDKVPVDINKIVREAADFTRPEMVRLGVQLPLRLADGLPLVLGDAIQLEQVVLNLLRNGLEASSSVEKSRRVVTIKTTTADHGVEVLVQDTGRGLSPDTVDRVFDPFHTTKPDGMGLGLSISRSIVETHGGRLWATPAPGGGAVFGFILPTADGANQNEQRADCVHC